MNINFKQHAEKLRAQKEKKSARRTIAVYGETYDKIDRLAGEYGLSLLETVKVLADAADAEVENGR